MACQKCTEYTLCEECEEEFQKEINELFKPRELMKLVPKYMVDSLRKENESLRKENRELQDQLAILYGALTDFNGRRKPTK